MEAKMTKEQELQERLEALAYDIGRKQEIVTHLSEIILRSEIDEYSKQAARKALKEHGYNS